MDNFAYKRNIILETDRKKIILKIEGGFQNDSLGTRELCALSVIDVFFTVVLWEKKKRSGMYLRPQLKRDRRRFWQTQQGVV